MYIRRFAQINAYCELRQQSQLTKLKNILSITPVDAETWLLKLFYYYGIPK